MNRKAFLIMLGLLVLLGGAGLVLFWQDLSSWHSSEYQVGSKLFEKLPVNDVAQIHIVDGNGEATLAIKDQRWVVKQRRDYDANHQQISDLLLKLPDLKVVQTESVGPTLLPRLNLVPPGSKDAKDAENAGTQLELSDKNGKVLASLLLGKKVIKIEDSPLPIKQQKEVGRYVLIPGNPTVLVISDALSTAQPKPETWLAKDFFKVDRIKSLSSSGNAGASWKIARSEEFGDWKFADGSQLNPSAATAVVNSLTSLELADVAFDVKPDTTDTSRTLVAETFDNLTYTIKLAKKPDGDDYYLWFTVSGEPPRLRVPEKGEPPEKPEQKAALDKEFAEDLKNLDERLKLEKSLMPWTFVVTSKTLEPLLQDRAQLAPEKRPPATAQKQ